MKVIVGLGNPGAEYARTPHNMGFLVIDSLAERLGCRLKVSPVDLWVVVDDADIPLGSLRIRKSGGTGGHRGLASISEVLGTPEYGRVRVGIGRGGRHDLVRHVLGAFGREEWLEACKAMGMAADAVMAIVEQGADSAMNRFNVRPENKAGGIAVTAGGEKL